MKIAFVLDDTLDSTDGVQQYVLTLGRWYVSQGHTVHYIVGQTSRDDIDNVHSVTKNVRVSFNKNRLSVPLPASRRVIRELLQQEQFDVIHVQVPYSPFMAARVVRSVDRSKTAVIGTFHILPFSGKERFATRVLGIFLRRTNKLFDQFVSVSHPAQEFAKDSFGVNSIVIPNPVNLSKHLANRRTKNESLNIVFLGRLVARKGPIELLSAAKGLLEKYPQCQLHIYGDGELRSDIERIIKEYGVKNQVFLHGYVSEAQKYAALAGADIAVFPSLGGESFGIVLTEAIAAGANVVIGGDNPGYRSVLELPETLFDPKNVSDFQSCIEQYIIDEDFAAQVHKKQQELLDKYRVETVGPQLLDVYKEAIANMPRTKHNV